jgi:hypothetical protein
MPVVASTEVDPGEPCDPGESTIDTSSGAIWMGSSVMVMTPP